MPYRSRIPKVAAALHPLVTRADRETAEQVVEAARQRVHRRSGDLHDAIHVEPEEGGGFWVVGGDENVWYGHLEEFGTNDTGAHPFLVPALYDVAPQAINRVRTAVLQASTAGAL